MAVSFIPWWITLIWAVFATVFYYFRYRKVDSLRNPWIMLGIFAANFFFFAFAVLIFIALELIRSKRKKRKEE